MPRTIDATFDGTVFHPAQPVDLKPNTRVKIIVEAEQETDSGQASFLETASALKLDGPPDWSKNIDQYLYDNPSADHAETVSH